MTSSRMLFERVTRKSMIWLRTHGFSDPQIADIAMCAALRCFVARYFEAVGAGPEAKFIDEDPAARATLTVGRPLAARPAEAPTAQASLNPYAC